jgi:hypothetical protein
MAQFNSNIPSPRFYRETRVSPTGSGKKIRAKQGRNLVTALPVASRTMGGGTLARQANDCAAAVFVV